MEFKEWWESDTDDSMMTNAVNLIANVHNMSERCKLLSEFWALQAWEAQTVKLNAALSELAEANNKIKSFDAYVMRDAKVKEAISALETERDESGSVESAGRVARAIERIKAIQ